MNVWKLTAANKLVLSEEPVPISSEDKIKVRVTKVLLCNQDAAVFHGRLKTKYPLIPGRFAVGIVAEDHGADYLKGMRVLLNTYLPAEDSGTAKKDFSEDDYDICGQTRDGFLRDIISLSPDELTPLPDSVSDEDALLLHHVALAKAIVDKLDVKKGQHIAVVGASGFGILVCQLLIYQQAAPILIDCDESRLDFASSCGIYYTLHTENDLLEQVGVLTGGRLTDGAVFVTDLQGVDPSVAFSVCAREANVVIGGFTTYETKMELGEALRKQLTVHCLSDYVENLEMAINLTANQAVHMKHFKAKPVQPDTLTEFFATYASYAEHEERDYIYVKLL